MATRFIETQAVKKQAVGNQLQFQHIKRICVKQSLTLVATGDTDTDLGYVDMTSGRDAEGAKYIVTAAWVVARTAPATLAASVLTLRTAAAGAGTEITTATTMTGMTAAGKFKAMTIGAGADVLTATKIYVRQTTDSANVGVVDVYIEIVDVRDLA